MGDSDALISEEEPEIKLSVDVFPQNSNKEVLRSDSSLRWVILPLLCVSMFGSYYCYDNPSALKLQMQYGLGIDDFQFSLFYSLYSFPNILLPFFGGFLTDYFGSNLVLIVCLSFNLLGQGVFVAGITTNIYWLACIGRIVFGFGGESLCVVATTILAVWFQGSYTAFALGLFLSMARLGSVANDNVSLALFDLGDNVNSGLSIALWFAFVLSILSLLTGCLTVFFDRLFVSRNRISGILRESEINAVAEKPTLRHILSFKLSFWLLLFSCVIVYAAILPFNNILGGFLVQHYGYDEETKGLLLGVPFFISAICSPFLGIIVDRFGKRAFLSCISSIGLTLAHTWMYFPELPVLAALITLGLSYCLYAAVIWPSISLVVHKNHLGTAYGLTTAVQNLGLALTPLIVGILKDYYKSWSQVQILFASISFVGILINFALYFADRKNNFVLNRPSSSFLPDPESSGTIIDAETKTPLIHDSSISYTEPSVESLGLLQTKTRSEDG